MDDHLKRYHVSKYFPWIAMGIILFSTVVLRLSMLQMLLERDEGEFAYMGQLLLQGLPPYLTAYSMKLPGMCFIYAFIMAIFGQSTSAIHLGLLIFNGIAIVLVFLLTRYIVDEIAGVVAAFVYAFLSVSPSFLGTSAHATQFLVPFALGGLLLLLKAIDQGKTWLMIASGFLLGMAFLVKQHAIFFVIFAIIYYFLRLRSMSISKRETIYKMALLIISSMLPFLVICGLLFLAGVFPNFWFWTFTYASKYASEEPVSMALTRFVERGFPAIYPWRLIWCLAVLGLSAIFWNKKMRSHWDFLVGFSIFSILTICPGFHFRPHYFITLLPAVSMLSGVAVSASMIYLSQGFSPYLKILPVIFITLALGLPAWQQSDFFRTNSIEASRMIYGNSNPLIPESHIIATYIKNHSSKEDIIAVIGSEPQIYFYANSKSATGYIYMFGLMEPHVYASQMQREMIHEIESARPRYVVLVNEMSSWYMRPKSDPNIIYWAERYLKNHYYVRGVINIMSDLKLNTKVNSQDFRTVWKHNLSVLERKS